jgi:RNA polymerase sigma factor (sigma-70 family)
MEGRRLEIDSQPEALSLALQRVGRGDPAALKDVYERTSAKLFGVCVRILHEASEAEDVLQEVYTRVWLKAAVFDPARGSPITWLATIARNRALDRLRARPNQPNARLEAALEVADGGTAADELMLQSEQVGRLHGCLGELEAGQQKVVREAFLDGYTYDALARRDGVPLATMKSRVRRALGRLKMCLER